METEETLNILYMKMVELVGNMTYEEFIADGGTENKETFERWKNQLIHAYCLQRILLAETTKLENSLMLR